MPVPILLGLVIISAAVILLVYYLASHDPATLVFTASGYAATVAAHLGFEKLRKRYRSMSDPRP